MRHLVKKDSILFINIDSITPDKEDIIKSDDSKQLSAPKQLTFSQSNAITNGISTTTRCDLTPNILNGTNNIDVSPESLLKNIELNEQLSELIDLKELDQVMQDLNDIDFDNSSFAQIKSQTNGQIDAIVNDLKTNSNMNGPNSMIIS